MIKKALILASILFLLCNVSALRINEVEMNPVEGKSGDEWIELYNDDEDINVSGWEIWEGISGASGSKKINYTFPEGAIIQSKEYYFIELSKTVLNNGGDFVILKDSSGNEIDKTPELSEAENSSKTHQFCSSEWIFNEATKGTENNCQEEDEEQEEQEEENSPEQNSSEDTETDAETHNLKNLQKVSLGDINLSSAENITLERILLNPQIIKTIDNEEGNNKPSYAVYGLTGFCILLATLFAIKKFRKNKNEFRE